MPGPQAGQVPGSLWIQAVLSGLVSVWAVNCRGQGLYQERVLTQNEQVTYILTRAHTSRLEPSLSMTSEDRAPEGRKSFPECPAL